MTKHMGARKPLGLRISDDGHKLLEEQAARAGAANKTEWARELLACAMSDDQLVRRATARLTSRQDESS